MRILDVFDPIIHHAVQTKYTKYRANLSLPHGVICIGSTTSKK